VFFGKGGYDWETVYNMPIWLRRFTFNNINEFYEKEQEEYNKALGKSETITANSKIAKPGVKDLSKLKPTYSSTVHKK